MEIIGKYQTVGEALFKNQGKLRKNFNFFHIHKKEYIFTKPLAITPWTSVLLSICSSLCFEIGKISKQREWGELLAFQLWMWVVCFVCGLLKKGEIIYGYGRKKTHKT